MTFDFNALTQQMKEERDKVTDTDLGPSFGDENDAGNDELTIDLSGVEARAGFEALPAGWYRVAITDWDKTETRNAGKLPQGTPGINWEFTIQEGEYEGRKLWTNHWLAHSSLPYLKGMLSKLEVAETGVFDGQLNLAEIAEAAQGQELWVRAARRMYNGEWRNDVRNFHSLAEHEEDSDSGDRTLMP